MKTISMAAMFVAGLSALPTGAGADSSTHFERWLNARDNRQDERLDQGLASGSLTYKEAARIQRNDLRLDAATDRALSDGDISNREFWRLNKGYNRESGFIYKQKHDGQVR